MVVVFCVVFEVVNVLRILERDGGEFFESGVLNLVGIEVEVGECDKLLSGF